MKPKVFKKGKQWYFHIKADNGEIVAQSEGYKNKKDAEKTLALITKKEPSKGKNISIGMSHVNKTTYGTGMACPHGEKWYQTIWDSVKYNLPLGLIGVGLGYLAFKIFIIMMY